jgi:hypothetical protein
MGISISASTPQEQWLEIRSVCNPGNLVGCSQVFSPDKTVSIPFDACAAVDKGGCGGTGCGCGGLAWERAYTSNDKYMCGETTLGHVTMWVLLIVLIGVVFRGPHGRGLSTQPSFTRGKLSLTAPIAPVTL